MTDEERLSEYQRLAKKQLKSVEDLYVPSNNPSKWNISDLISWLKESYVTHLVNIDELRHRLHVLRDHVLNWPETQRRIFTVEDAQQLNVCRICKKESTPLPDNPLILDYGKEFAHQKCIQKEDPFKEAIRILQDKISECNLCSGTARVGIFSCSRCGPLEHAIKQLQKCFS